MQTKFNELWSLFSQNFAQTFAQCQLKLRTKFVHKVKFCVNILQYFERSNEKLLLRRFANAKIRGNKKELKRYKNIAAMDITSDHTAERSMSECPIPVLITLENIFYKRNVKLNCKQKKYRKVADLFIFKLS